jgi:hypothetical protein
MNESLSILIKKNPITRHYIPSEAISYDFYLLFLLSTESLSQAQSNCAKMAEFNFKKNDGIFFYKTSSIKCLATQQLFLNKNNGYIEIFSIYDLMNTDQLDLPKSPKLIMTAKNFMNFMVQKSQIQKNQPQEFFIAIDEQGHAHITTDLQSINKKSFLQTLQKKIINLFWKKA